MEDDNVAEVLAEKEKKLMQAVGLLHSKLGKLKLTESGEVVCGACDGKEFEDGSRALAKVR